MGKLKQKTPKHEAETCWNTSHNRNKSTARISLISLILYRIKFRDFNLRVSFISRVLNFAIVFKIAKIANLVLAKLSENKL